LQTKFLIIILRFGSGGGCGGGGGGGGGCGGGGGDFNISPNSKIPPNTPLGQIRNNSTAWAGLYIYAVVTEANPTFKNHMGLNVYKNMQYARKLLDH